MQKIGEALEKLLKKLPEAQKKLKGFESEEIWADEIDPAGRSRVYNYANGTVYVETESPAYAQELTFNSESLAERLNKRIGEKIIKNIRVRIGSLKK